MVTDWSVSIGLELADTLGRRGLLGCSSVVAACKDAILLSDWYVILSEEASWFWIDCNRNDKTLRVDVDLA